MRGGGLVQPPCAFCGENHTLRESHILPAFLFRWLRAYSLTGHIRDSDTPNRRVQDGLKKPWLCDGCEGQFSAYETAFAGKLFHPWLSGKQDIRYEEWLLRFCVSVSWRVLMHCKGSNPTNVYTQKQEELISEAEVAWRAFLIGARPHPGTFEQHLVIWDMMESTNVPDMPPNINRFLLGAITMDIVGGDNSLMTFAKMGRFMLFGMIQKGPHTWLGTKIHVREGYLKPGEITLPKALMTYISDRARMVADVYAGISEAQHKKMEADAMRDIDRIAKSDQFAAMLADAEMFGEHVLIRPGSKAPRNGT